jgi:hypothetical protein
VGRLIAAPLDPACRSHFGLPNSVFCCGSSGEKWSIGCERSVRVVEDPLNFTTFVAMNVAGRVVLKKSQSRSCRTGAVRTDQLEVVFAGPEP